MAILYFVKRKRFVRRPRLESLFLLCFMNQLRGELEKQQQQQIGQTKELQTRQKLNPFAPRMYGSLFLCLILVFLGPVKGIFHTESITRIYLNYKLN